MEGESSSQIPGGQPELTSKWEMGSRALAREVVHVRGEGAGVFVPQFSSVTVKGCSWGCGFVSTVC